MLMTTYTRGVKLFNTIPFKTQTNNTPQKNPHKKQQIPPPSKNPHQKNPKKIRAL